VSITLRGLGWVNSRGRRDEKLSATLDFYQFVFSQAITAQSAAVFDLIAML